MLCYALKKPAFIGEFATIFFIYNSIHFAKVGLFVFIAVHINIHLVYRQTHLFTFHFEYGAMFAKQNDAFQYFN